MLLDEGVPIADLRAVLEACLEGGQDASDEDELVAAARPRIGLAMVRRHLTAGTLRAHRVSDGRPAARSSMSESTVAALHEDLLALGVAAGSVLLADAILAPRVRDVVRARFPDVSVITADDLLPAIDVHWEEAVLLR